MSLDKILRKLGLCRTSNVVAAVMELRDYTYDGPGDGHSSYTISDKDWRRFVWRAKGWR